MGLLNLIKEFVRYEGENLLLAGREIGMQFGSFLRRLGQIVVGVATDPTVQMLFVFGILFLVVTTL